MKSDDVDKMLQVLLTQFNVTFERQDIGESSIYEISEFGTKVVYMDGQMVDRKILNGWNVAYVHPDFNENSSRDRIVWALVRGGYFHYLRHNYKNTFNQMMNSQGWDKKLIEYRKKIYKEIPKYGYWKRLNDDGLNAASSYVLSMDPGFYDMIID